MTDAAVVQIPRPKTPQSYDRGTTERTYQSLEQAIQNKHDKRGHLYLEPGKELVLTSDDSSAQYGIGLDVGGYIRIRDMSDGSIGTFSVAWAQVDGAEQEIADLQAYVDAADSTLTGSVGVNAAAIAANGVSIAGIETEITAARDGEADLAAKFSRVEGAFASADAAIASDVTALQSTLEAADSSLQSSINSEISTRATQINAAAADRTLIRSEFAAADTAAIASANSYTDTEVTAEGAARATAIDEVEARVRALTLPDRPSIQADFSSAFSTFDASALTDGSVVEVAGEGDVLEVDGGQHLSNREALQISEGENYRISARARVTDDGSGNVLVFIFRVFNASGGYLGAYGLTTVDSSFTAAEGWQEHSISATAADIRSTYSTAAYIKANVVAGHASGSNTTNTIQYSFVRLETDIAASVSAMKAAFIDSDGNAYAGIRLVAEASGSDPAIIELVSADGSSNVRLGGDTEIDGDLVVNGTITTEGLATNAITSTEVDQTAGAITPTNNTWTDVADFSFTSVGIGVQLRGSCEVDIFTDGTSPTAQVRILRDATVLKTSKVFAAVDAGSGFQKVEQSIALDYNDLPESGTYTYKLQARLNEGASAVVVSTFDVTNRFLSATELKR